MDEDGPSWSRIAPSICWKRDECRGLSEAHPLVAVDVCAAQFVSPLWAGTFLESAGAPKVMRSRLEPTKKVARSLLSLERSTP